MRLHHLRMQAFGPFGDVVDVDFDDLNSAGQFLISGATGSGKTFILDAVCFALYGEVPGERQRAKHLRSDYARPDAEPRVTLTLTVAERLIRISRSPAWERPKRRGHGTTTQPASARLEQQIEGEWRVLATRLDETGHLIITWLGMTPVQFTQVALLPQGGFQTFLHSPSAARQAILQRLFRTDRFERVEKWFGELRRTLNRSRAEAQHALDVIAHRLAEAADRSEPPPGTEDIDGLELWARAQCADLTTIHDQSVSMLGSTDLANRAARAQLTDAVALCYLQDRAAEAQRHLFELEQSASAFAEQQARLDAHDRARVLVPLLRTHTVAQAEAATAHTTMTMALAELPTTPFEDLEDARASATQEVARAEQAIALSESLAALRTQRAAAHRHWHEINERLTQRRVSVEAIPRDLADVAARLQSAVEAEIALASGLVDLESVRRGHQAASALDLVRDEYAEKVELRRQTIDRVHDLRQTYLDAREARIEGMASELAVDLVVGCSCPVCGSTAHPAPAVGSRSSGRKAEERARRRYENATVELAALDEVLAVLNARMTNLGELSLGEPVDTWNSRLKAQRDLVTRLSAEAAQVPVLRADELALHQRHESAHAEIATLTRDEAEASVRLEQLDARIQESTDTLIALLGDHRDVVAYLEYARRNLNLIVAAIGAREAWQAAQKAADQQQAALDKQALACGFASTEQAAAAILEQHVATRFADALHQRRQKYRAALEVLDDPAIAEALEAPRPDLAGLQEVAEATDAALTEARTQEHLAATRLRRTAEIVAELGVAVAAYRPLATKAEQITALSGLLEGTGADNRLRMRLSAFVLAERLRQVIAAANARLEVISEGRYLLHYQEERGAADSRGGLSLSVLDEWTGIHRDPTTLSGGETFVVSLCLALGLADTVADETGGLRIDTLFIDEGFGSLDAQTLDSVIDILSQLSEGGRVTGLVSHVQELKERLPAVLEVVGSKSGSTVRGASA